MGRESHRPEGFERLRKLPEQVAQLRERVSEIAPTVGGAVSEANLRVDLDRLRDAARRNAATLVAGAQQASERAAAVYSELVVRGERVVRNVRTTEAAIEVAPAAGTVTATTTQKQAAKKAPAKKAPAKSA